MYIYTPVCFWVRVYTPVYDTLSVWKEATRPATPNLRVLKQRVSGWVGPSQGEGGRRDVDDLLSLVDDKAFCCEEARVKMVYCLSWRQVGASGLARVLR